MINFKKVELEDQKAYKPYMAQQQCRSCECTFANLYLWSRFYAVTATVENGMLLTKSEEGDYLSYGFPMGKPKYLKEAVDALYEYSKEKKRKFQMHNVTPEQFALLEEIYPGRFQIEYRRDYADYVYEAEKLAKMTEEEKTKYLQQKREKNLTDREAAVTRKELMAEAKNTLASDNLPVELAEVLDYTDADSCMKSMEKVKNAFQKAVEAAVEEKLKGGKPQKKAPETDTQKALEQQVYNAMMGKY